MKLPAYPGRLHFARVRPIPRIVLDESLIALEAWAVGEWLLLEIFEERANHDGD